MAGDQNSFLSFNAALTYNAVAPAGLERRWRKPTESSGAAVSYIGCLELFLEIYASSSLNWFFRAPARLRCRILFL